MELSDNVFKLVYGADVDIPQIKKLKNTKEIWNDIMLFLADNDITKLDDIKKMNLIDFLEILNSKVKGVPRIKHKPTPIGYDIPGSEPKYKK
ncbi:MAG: hypothetical protein J0L69_10390 [Bacteroidetes bacterium]|nr:hypothetical protein [Bacteroidota bacterium]